ncbi:MAG: ABC transporter permease [Alcanivoracaceae bacterium]|nr:ABC transporter permease [Alcanivoracaceae bacterium]
MSEFSRLLFRPWRDSAFRVLALSLFVASVSLTAILLLRAELESRFEQRTAEMLGGDIELDSARPEDPAQAELLKQYDTSRNVRFRSVLVEGDEILLVGIKAVDDQWPLYGSAHIAASRFADTTLIEHGPQQGEVWVAEQVLDRLQVKVGDSITIGSLALPISAVIRQEPDQGAGFYSMTPRVLMHHADLPSTGILAQGSRANFEVSVRTDNIDGLKNALEETLRPDQEIDTVGERQSRSLGPMRQMTLWISLGVLLIALLCGAAIYLTTSLRVARKARLAALLRTFGAPRAKILRRLLGEELIAILPAVVSGVVLGILLLLFTREVLGWSEPLAAGVSQWMAVCIAPFALFSAFALPRLSSLVQIPAIRVLNRTAEGTLRRNGLELAAALVGPVLLAALLMGSAFELLTLLLLLGGLGAVLPLLLWPALRLLERAASKWTVSRRLAIRRLSRRPATTLPLLAALSLAMTILTLAGLTGTGLLADWRQKLPDNAPNHFVINLFDADRDVLAEWQSQHNAKPEPLYPIVRGRLTEINDEPVREAVTKENDQAARALNRDLALTESATIPVSNQLSAGVWHGTTPGEVSVEKELAEGLQLNLGDKLTFVTSRGELHTNVTSIRDVDWESFAPNFYFMFSPGDLANEDVTWLTSFWLPEGDGQRLAQLMQALPHITLFDVNAILDQAQQIVKQASQATAVLAGLLILASLLVLSAALLSTARQRQADQALLRVFGAQKSLLRSINRLEFLALGLCAAGVAVLMVLMALMPLAALLFDGQVPGLRWLLLPPCLGVVVAAIGLFTLHRQQATPSQLLQDN